MEAITSRLEAIATRVEVISLRNIVDLALTPLFFPSLRTLRVSWRADQDRRGKDASSEQQLRECPVSLVCESKGAEPRETLRPSSHNTEVFSPSSQTTRPGQIGRGLMVLLGIEHGAARPHGEPSQQRGVRRCHERFGGRTFRVVFLFFFFFNELFVCLFVCLVGWLVVCLFVCLFVCVFQHLFLDMFMFS